MSTLGLLHSLCRRVGRVLSSGRYVPPGSVFVLREDPLIRPLSSAHQQAGRQSAAGDV